MIHFILTVPCVEKHSSMVKGVVRDFLETLLRFEIDTQTNTPLSK